MCNLPNTYPIPLGINPIECQTNLSYFLKFINIDKNKPLKFTNFNRIRDGIYKDQLIEKVASELKVKTSQLKNFQHQDPTSKIQTKSFQNRKTSSKNRPRNFKNYSNH